MNSGAAASTDAADDAAFMAAADATERALQVAATAVAAVGTLVDTLLVDTREGRARRGISNDALCAALTTTHRVETRQETLSNFDFWYVLRCSRTNVQRVVRVYERKTMTDLESSQNSSHWDEQIARLQQARGSDPSYPLPEFVLLLVGEWISLRDPLKAAALSGICSRLQTYYAHASVIPVASDALLPQVLATDIRHCKERANGFRFDELPELKQLKRTMLRDRVDNPDTWTLFSYGSLHGVSVKLAQRIQTEYPLLRQAMDAARDEGPEAFTKIDGIGGVLAQRIVECLAPERPAPAAIAKPARRKRPVDADGAAQPAKTKAKAKAKPRPKAKAKAKAKAKRTTNDDDDAFWLD